jgi:hypothetical protein
VKILVTAQFSRFSDEVQICQSTDRPSLFSDVAQDAWYAYYACIGGMSNVVQGYPDGTFRPAQPVSAVEASKLLIHTFGLSVDQSFSEPWYLPYVQEMEERNAFPPTTTVTSSFLTRGEIAYMLYQLSLSDKTTESTSPVKNPTTVPTTNTLSNARVSKLTYTSAMLLWDSEGTTLPHTLCVSTSTRGLSDEKNCRHTTKQNSYELFNLDPNTTYYWKLFRTVKNRTTTFGPHSFTTLELNNTPPSVSLTGTTGLTSTSVTVHWYAYDLDKDPLSYQVCLAKFTQQLYNDGNCTGITRGGASSYIYYNLDPSTTYYWAVKVSDKLKSTSSSYSSFRTLDAPNKSPEVSLRGSSSEGTSSMRVSWNASDPEGKSLSTWVCLSTSAQTVREDYNCRSLGSTYDRSYLWNNLSTGIYYYWTVKVSDGVTTVTPSYNYFMLTANRTPTVSIAGVYNVTSSSAYLSWVGNDPDNNALRYRVCFTSIASILYNDSTCTGFMTSTNYTLSNLIPNTQYWVIVRVYDDKSDAMSSYMGFVTSKGADLAPSISSTTAYPSQNGVVLTWNASDPEGKALTSQICLSTNYSTVYTAGNCIYNTSQGQTSYALSQLTSGTTYYYIIRVSDGTTTVNSGTYSFTTLSQGSTVIQGQITDQ